MLGDEVGEYLKIVSHRRFTNLEVQGHSGFNFDTDSGAANCRAWSGNRQISSCRLFQQPKHNMPLPRAKTRPAARGNVWTRATASSALSTDSSHATVQPFNEVTQDRKTKRTGAFQAIPMVPNADEHLAAALKRAARVIASSKLKNEAAKARNRASRRMDGDHSIRHLNLEPHWIVLICSDNPGTLVLEAPAHYCDLKRHLSCAALAHWSALEGCSGGMLRLQVTATC